MPRNPHDFVRLVAKHYRLLTAMCRNNHRFASGAEMESFVRPLVDAGATWNRSFEREWPRSNPRRGAPAWARVVQQQAVVRANAEASQLHTPNAENVRRLFETTIGYNPHTSALRSSSQTRHIRDTLIRTRGDCLEPSCRAPKRMAS